MTISKSDPIIIVGAGAFGLSTALRLTEAGFHDITVLEKDDALPSRFSAANDLNKIVRPEYEDSFYTELTLVSQATLLEVEMKKKKRKETSLKLTISAFLGANRYRLGGDPRLGNANIRSLLPQNWLPTLRLRPSARTCRANSREVPRRRREASRSPGPA